MPSLAVGRRVAPSALPRERRAAPPDFPPGAQDRLASVGRPVATACAATSWCEAAEGNDDLARRGDDRRFDGARMPGVARAPRWCVGPSMAGASHRAPSLLGAPLGDSAPARPAPHSTRGSCALPRHATERSDVRAASLGGGLLVWGAWQLLGRLYQQTAFWWCSGPGVGLSEFKSGTAAPPHT